MMGVPIAHPRCDVGADVRYIDHHGRICTGKVMSIEAKWTNEGGFPCITYAVTHPSYRGRWLYTGDVTPMEPHHD